VPSPTTRCSSPPSAATRDCPVVCCAHFLIRETACTVSLPPVAPSRATRVPSARRVVHRHCDGWRGFGGWCWCWRCCCCYCCCRSTRPTRGRTACAWLLCCARGGCVLERARHFVAGEAKDVGAGSSGLARCLSRRVTPSIPLAALPLPLPLPLAASCRLGRRLWHWQLASPLRTSGR
jgi:hypothetical protein